MWQHCRLGKKQTEAAIATLAADKRYAASFVVTPNHVMESSREQARYCTLRCRRERMRVCCTTPRYTLVITGRVVQARLTWIRPRLPGTQTRRSDSAARITGRRSNTGCVCSTTAARLDHGLIPRSAIMMMRHLSKATATHYAAACCVMIALRLVCQVAAGAYAGPLHTDANFPARAQFCCSSRFQAVRVQLTADLRTPTQALISSCPEACTRRRCPQRARP